MGTGRLAGLALTVVAAGTFAAGCSSGSDDKVTKGDLKAFAAGAGTPIDGRAEMVRRENGTTFVTVRATGLKSGGRYASHVHNKRCDDGAAGGHFQQNGASAGVTPPNEIWPGGGPVVTKTGKIAINTTAKYVANPDAISVVIHDLSLPSTGNKVACADLT